jgi:hypothetical protein
MSQSFFEAGKESPKKFLDNLKKDKHLLLLYEDIEKAAQFQIDYIIQGLRNEECCVIAMPHQVNLVEKLKERDIDVKKYQKRRLLYVLEVPNTNNYSEAFKIFQNFSSQILSFSSGKLRVCGMLGFDLSQKEGMEAFIKAETTSHQNFDSFSGSWLCSYNIKKIEKKEKMSWLKKLFRCHDSVIVIPSEESGISFDLR